MPDEYDEKPSLWVLWFMTSMCLITSILTFKSVNQLSDQVDELQVQKSSCFQHQETSK